MFPNHNGFTRIAASAALILAAGVVLGGCSTTSTSQKTPYAITGGQGGGFVAPRSAVDSKGHYHPDWYFHGAPRQIPYGQGQ